MPLLPAAFILPPGGTGELDPSWWGDGALVGDLLPAWIASGEGEVPAGAGSSAADAVVRAYVYGTAYDNKAGQLAGTPNKQNTAGVEFNEEYTKEQRAWFEAKAASWWTKFASAVAEATPVTPATVIDSPPRVSFAQPIMRAF